MSAIDSKPIRYLLQAINYTVFMALIWYFSTSPAIHIIADNESVVTIAFAHAGEIREPCRKLSNEELMKLPPNMRKPEECSRARSPLVIEAKLDGEIIYSKIMQPPGIFNDGSVDIYYRRIIPAGKHQFEIKMDDSVRKKGFNYAFKQDMNIKPGQILLIGFDPLNGFSVK